MSETYRELDHPADLLLEVRGERLELLAENALFALYDSVVDVDAVRPRDRVDLVGRGDDPARALRALLAEALFAFDTQGFVGATALVVVSPDPGVPARAASPTTMSAVVWGEPLDRARHETRAEVKAVTYHRLSVEPEADGGWRAVFLLDV